jgi:hypothetical protein
VSSYYTYTHSKYSFQKKKYSVSRAICVQYEDTLILQYEDTHTSSEKAVNKHILVVKKQ